MACAAVAGVAALSARFGSLHGPDLYVLATIGFPFVWVTILALRGAYQTRWLTTGSEHFRRVVESGLILLGGTAVISFLLHADISRGYVFLVACVVTPLTLAARYASRKQLHRLIGRGATVHRVVVAGSTHEVENVVRHMRRASYAGFRVISACTLDGEQFHEASFPEDVTVMTADIDRLPDAVRAAGADTLAIAGSSMFPTGALRRLSWRLEGMPVQLIVAPAVTDFAGPRIVVRPVDGLPLLHIDEPDLHGVRQAMKTALDLALALLMAIVLSPLLVGSAVAIKLAGGGPVVFRQRRIGRHGEPFQMWKFRTMVVGAEEQLADLHQYNEHDGLLFKIRADPRVTPVGRFLRRHSIDELPQLFNVLSGSMSLVGPRPPLPAEVDGYGEEMRRRLLVKPGMTGLWQVNGRTDLPWQEAVRLDLHYVENWSPALDMMVLWKTLAVVLRGEGGY